MSGGRRGWIVTATGGAAIALATGVAHAQDVVDPPPPASGWHRASVTVRLDPAAPRVVEADGVHTIGTGARSVTVRIDRTRPHATAEVVRDGIRVTATDALSGAATLEVRVNSARWRRHALDEALFDGTAASLARWRQGGAGRFDLAPEGALRTVGGLGLLWYDAREFGDAVFRLQWREGRADGQRSNAGVFVRFPRPGSDAACADRFPIAWSDDAWHAVACGHEIQINDADVDPQRTGSVYGFAPLDAQASPPGEFGAWNAYEIRVEGRGAYDVTVVRDGRVLNRFRNTPGQSPAATIDSPAALPRLVYPPTDVKQYAAGFFGLQNHGNADTIEFRDVRVLPLAPRTRTIALRRAKRPRTVRVRAVDVAGNRSRTVVLRLPARRR